MNQPRNWKTLERHPLSAEYEDVKGDVWASLLASIRDFGFDPKRAITMAPDVDDENTLKIGDGWQRQRACVELGIKPVYVMLPRGMPLTDLIRRDNDARRHESDTQRDKRLEARRARVSEAVKEGTPLRKIAEKEGVSAATVHKDAKVTGTTSPRHREAPPSRNGHPTFDNQRIFRVLKDVRPVLDKKENVVGKGDLPPLSADLKKDRDALKERLCAVSESKNRYERCHQLMSALLEEIKLWT